MERRHQPPLPRQAMRQSVRRALALVALASMVAVSLITSTPAGAADQFIPEEIVGSTDPLVSNDADSLPWGVVGLGNWTHVSTNLRVPVFAIEVIGDRVFVGGMFDQAQQGSGGTQVSQPFLAAFDLATGEFIDTWRPQVNASVYALAATSDGKLIVGGDFTNINGEPFTAALAALDPMTGQVISTWRSHLERPWSTNEPVVRAIEVRNGWVYAAGNFSHQQSFASRTRVYKAVKVAESDGILDTSWLPQVTGAGLWALDVAPDASRTTLGGYHTAINAQPDTQWIGVVNDSTGATIPGLVYTKTHPSSGHIQAIADTGSKLYYSGSQHFIFQHDTASWAREEGTTYVSGGDGQAIEIADGIIYNACHCALQTAYTDSYTWPNPSPGATAHDINGISAHAQSDFGYVDEFQPAVYYESGDGAWALEFDVRGCLWVGGDVYRLNDDLPYRWARGFTRLCQDDHEAPTIPTSLSAVVGGINQDEVTLSWAPSTDNREVASYEVYRDGDLVGTSTTTSYLDTGVVGTAIYRVRAVDTRGNISATSEPLTVEPPVQGAVYVAPGATWRYLDDGSNPGPTWSSAAFDDATWNTGAAQLGFGDGDEATILTSGFVNYYMRHTFTASAPLPTTLEVQILADDGAVVYLNGQELVRDNMPAGPLGFPAWAADWKGGAAENAFTSYTVGAGDLVAGQNTLAVSVHNASAGSGDLSFDLRLSASTDEPPPMPVEAIAAGATWRYLDDGSSPAPAWTTSAFDDTAWASGPAQLGYGDGDEATVITEGQPRHITTYYRHGFTVADATQFAALSVHVVRDDGVVIYLNGTELVRDNMPQGPITSSTLASGYVWGANETDFQLFSVPAGALVSGTNTLAVEIHSADPGSADMSFDLSLTLDP